MNSMENKAKGTNFGAAGAGQTDYNALVNKPTINGELLVGNINLNVMTDQEKAELALVLSRSVVRIELECTDDQHITLKGKTEALTYEQIKALVDDHKKFVTLRYMDVWWMLPAYDDGGAIMFTSSDIEGGHPVTTRVVINTEGELNNYSVNAEDSDHKTDDLSKEVAPDGHMTYPTTHAVNQQLTELDLKVGHINGVMGPYTEREPIVLTLQENGKAINRAGVKVDKAGWAICSFVGQKGDVYSFDPGVMDNDVCIFSEEIIKKEYRPIEYKYTYDAEGLPTKATATYNGAIHSYTFTYEKDDGGHVTSETITDDQTGEVLNALPYQYQSVIGTYHPLTILNASAELPLDHHCRLISHFQGEGTIRVTVSFNVASANMNLLVFRDGLIANLATQLGTIFQMISETNKALSLLETQVKSLDSAVTNIVHTTVDDSALHTLCGQPPILFGAGTPQEAIVPDNWKQFDPETGDGYNWNGEPSAAGQQYINTSASTGGRYIAVPSANGGLTWKNF